MSDTPQKTGRIAQIRDAYRAIKSIDPKLGQWMLLAALLTAAVIIGLGIWGGGFWILYAVVIAIPAAALAATLVMNRRGNNAMYAALEGKAGAVGAALQGIGRRGWYAALEPVAVDAPRGTKANDMSGAAMVFRALGRPGVVLIGEGPDARVQKLLKAEEKKASRVAPGVPIHLWTAGDAEGQVPVRKIAAGCAASKTPQASPASRDSTAYSSAAAAATELSASVKNSATKARPQAWGLSGRPPMAT